MPIQSVGSYAMPSVGPSDVDYIVQGINSYFARQREDQLRQEALMREQQLRAYTAHREDVKAFQKEKSDLAGYFANRGELAPAQPGQKVDFIIGGSPWVVKEGAKKVPLAVVNEGGIQVPLYDQEDVASFQNANRAGQASPADIFSIRKSALLSTLALKNIGFEDQDAIIDIYERKWRGETVDVSKYSKTVQDFVKRENMASSSPATNNSILGKVSASTNKMIDDSVAKLKERFKGKSSNQIATELVTDAGKMISTPSKKAISALPIFPYFPMQYPINAAINMGNSVGRSFSQSPMPYQQQTTPPGWSSFNNWNSLPQQTTPPGWSSFNNWNSLPQETYDQRKPFYGQY